MLLLHRFLKSTKVNSAYEATRKEEVDKSMLALGVTGGFILLIRLPKQNK